MASSSSRRYRFLGHVLLLQGNLASPDKYVLVDGLVVVPHPHLICLLLLADSEMNNHNNYSAIILISRKKRRYRGTVLSTN